MIKSYLFKHTSFNKIKSSRIWNISLTDDVEYNQPNLKYKPNWWRKLKSKVSLNVTTLL